MPLQQVGGRNLEGHISCHSVSRSRKRHAGAPGHFQSSWFTCVSVIDKITYFDMQIILIGVSYHVEMQKRVCKDCKLYKLMIETLTLSVFIFNIGFDKCLTFMPGRAKVILKNIFVCRAPTFNFSLGR